MRRQRKTSSDMPYTGDPRVNVLCALQDGKDADAGIHVKP